VPNMPRVRPRQWSLAELEERRLRQLELARQRRAAKKEKARVAQALLFEEGVRSDVLPPSVVAALLEHGGCHGWYRDFMPAMRPLLKFNQGAVLPTVEEAASWSHDQYDSLEAELGAPSFAVHRRASKAERRAHVLQLATDAARSSLILKQGSGVKNATDGVLYVKGMATQWVGAGGTHVAFPEACARVALARLLGTALLHTCCSALRRVVHVCGVCVWGGGRCACACLGLLGPAWACSSAVCVLLVLILSSFSTRASWRALCPSCLRRKRRW
jgi:hypothetical protein